MSVPVQREVMFIIDRFVEEAPPGKSSWKICFVYHSFFFLDEILKIKICHTVVNEHPDVIEGRQQLISVDVIDSEEAAEDSSIDNDDAALDEEDGSGLLGAGVTEDVVDMQKTLNYSSL